MRRVINVTFCLNQREQRLLALGNVEPDGQQFKRLLLREAARNLRLEVQMTLDLFEQAVAPPETTPPKKAKEKLARIAITPDVPTHDWHGAKLPEQSLSDSDHDA